MNASRVVDNDVEEGGGGLVIEGGNSTVTETTFDNNTSFLFGAGIVILDGEVDLIRSTVSNNEASSDGGGIWHDFGRLRIINSTISGNRATGGSGGGIYTRDSDDTTSGTIGSLDDDDLVIANSTITDNTAEDGAGLYNDASETNGSVIHNSIIAGNNGTDIGVDEFGPAATFDSSFNLFGIDDDSLVPDDNQNQLDVSDPGLLPLGDYGGPTQTHDLEENSPAVDQGGSIVGLSITTDQRGLARPVDNPLVDNAPGGNGSDIGSVEVGIGDIDLGDAPDGVAVPADAPPATYPTRLGSDGAFHLGVTGGAL